MTGETLSKPEESREALEFCDDIRNATELAEAATRLHNLAQRAVASVARKSLFNRLPYKLEVRIAPEMEALVIQHDDVTDPKPEVFIATGIRSVDLQGTEFYNEETSEELRIRGYDFEVSPAPKEQPEA
jgi:hypothetical protein